jgi:DNA-binding PucR family transcriptional regulator
VLLGELVAAPHLHLRLVYEPPGALDVPLRRVVTTDLLDPARYLTGGELVITGLVWRRSPDDSETFVNALVAGGAVAVAAGAALLGTVPDDLVEACRRHQLPLLEVPVEVAFADVTEHLAARSSAESGARLSATLVRQRQLLSAIASGRSLDELAARVSTEVGRVCRVVTASGRHVVAGSTELSGAAVDGITTAFLKADRLPATATAGDSTYSLFTVGSALGNRLASWIVVVEGAWTDWPAETVEAVNELAAIASLDRSRRDEGLRAVRHIAEDAISLAESGGNQVELNVRLRQAGLDPTRPMIALVAGFDGGTDMLEVLRGVVDDIALEYGAPVVAVDGDDRVVALLHASTDLDQALRTSFERLVPGVVRGQLSVGISTPSNSDALSGALEEARYARRLAAAKRVPVSVVAADEVTSHVILLATVPDDVRRAFATRVLGRVLDYDTRNNAELVETLEAFMECSGSWSRTAEALHVHVNTVRYRIERVEELTGRDLGRLEDRVDVFLALRSL